MPPVVLDTLIAIAHGDTSLAKIAARLDARPAYSPFTANDARLACVQLRAYGFITSAAVPGAVTYEVTPRGLAYLAAQEAAP